MGILLLILGLALSLLGLVCSIIILIDAFKDAIWKGLVALLCGLYFLYYALAEFEHEKKWLIVAGSLLGGGLGYLLMTMGGINMGGGIPTSP